MLLDTLGLAGAALLLISGGLGLVRHWRRLGELTAPWINDQLLYGPLGSRNLMFLGVLCIAAGCWTLARSASVLVNL